MPIPFIQKLVKQGKGTEAELEALWVKAKKAAADEGRSGDFAYITGIFKKMAGIKEHFKSFSQFISEATTKPLNSKSSSVLQDVIKSKDGTKFAIAMDTGKDKDMQKILKKYTKDSKIIRDIIKFTNDIISKDGLGSFALT